MRLRPPPGTSACPTCVRFTTAIASASKAAPTSPSPRMSARQFLAYGWNVRRVSDANDIAMLQQAFEAFHNTTDRPTLIIVIAISPMVRPTSTISPRRTANRLARTRFAWSAVLRLRPGQGFRRAGWRARALRGESRSPWRKAAMLPGRTCSPAIAPNIPNLPTRSIASPSVRCPQGGSRHCRFFPASASGHVHARCLRQGAERPGRADSPG